MRSQPAVEFSEPHRPGLIQTGEEREGLDVIELQPVTVHLQKCCRNRHRYALVAVDEGMILGQAFPACSGFLNDVGIVASRGLANADSTAPRSRMPAAPPNRAIKMA